MVSIIMPCYNSEKYLSESIESVLGQSMKEWELLLIDDASTDRTCAIIESYANKEPRIRPFFLESNSSAAVARNIGIQNSKFKYIAFLDSDDLWVTNKLKVQVDLMEKHNILFSFSSHYIINTQGVIIGVRKAPESVTYQKLLNYGNSIPCLTVIYNREYFSENRFNEEIRIHEDYKMWLDMFQDCEEAIAIDCPLALYRVHPGSKNLNKLRSLKWNWLLWRKYENQSFLSSLLISIRWIVGKITQRVTM